MLIPYHTYEYIRPLNNLFFAFLHQRISKRTEELQSGAEDFASLANELVKAMEARKWYHI